MCGSISRSNFSVNLIWPCIITDMRP